MLSHKVIPNFFVLQIIEKKSRWNLLSGMLLINWWKFLEKPFEYGELLKKYYTLILLYEISTGQGKKTKLPVSLYFHIYGWGVNLGWVRLGKG